MGSNGDAFTASLVFAGCGIVLVAIFLVVAVLAWVSAETVGPTVKESLESLSSCGAWFSLSLEALVALATSSATRAAMSLSLSFEGLVFLLVTASLAERTDLVSLAALVKRWWLAAMKWSSQLTSVLSSAFGLLVPVFTGFFKDSTFFEDGD